MSLRTVVPSTLFHDHRQPEIVLKTGEGSASLRTSHSTEMAIDSILYMARNRQKAPFYADDIAAEMNISPTYLAKLFQQLARSGVLRSYRGARGGYNLGRRVEAITLYDIIIVFEGTLQFSHFQADAGNATHDSQCLVCNLLRETELRLRQVLESVTLKDLLGGDAVPAELALSLLDDEPTELR